MKFILSILLALIVTLTQAQPYFTIFDAPSTGDAATEVLNNGYLSHTAYNHGNGVYCSIIKVRDDFGNVIHEYSPFDTNYYSQPYGEMCLELFQDSSYLVIGYMDTTQAQNYEFLISRFKKFDKNHNELWSKDFFGNYYSHEFKQLKKLSTGEYAFVGTALLDPNLPGQGIVAKFDSNFNLLNTYHYGGPDIDILMSLEEVPGTGMLVGGREYVNGPGWISTLRLIDYNGNLIWKNEISNNGSNSIQYMSSNLEFLSDNTILNLVVTNPVFNSTISKTRIQKLDLAGNVIWEHQINSTIYNKLDLGRIFEVEEGCTVLYGIGQYPGNTQSLALMKINPLGNIIWEKKYVFDPISIDYAYEFEKIDNDNFVFTATFSDTNNVQNGTISRVNCNGEDGMQYALTSNCLTYDCSLYPMNTSFTASKTYINLNQESGWVDFENISPNTISREWHMDDGTIYYTDNSPSHEFIYDGVHHVKLISNHGSCTDTTWLDIEIVNGLIATEEIDKEELKIYPNPAKNRLNVKANFVVKRITIVSLTGEVVISTNQTNSTSIIDISQLNAGMYQVILEDDSGISYFEKIMVQ